MVFSLIEINFMAVLIAAIANFLLSAIWFSPLLTGCAWMKEMNSRGEDIDRMKEDMGLKLLGSFVCAYISAVILVVFMKVMGINDMVSGLNLGLMVAIGFVITALLHSHFSENRSMRLFLIATGHHVITYSAMGAILGAWG